MNQQELQPFHLAVPVDNIARARQFYRDVLGCEEGRSDTHWVDFNFFGHQLVIHYREPGEISDRAVNPVDGHEVPVPHFGIVLTPSGWKELADRLHKLGVEFIIEPYTRFKGETGEQSTMFLLDPCGNALEFKAFKDMDNLFRK